MARDRISRRAFLTTGAVGVVGGSAALQGAHSLAQDAPAAPEERNKRDGMRHRVLGRTNLLVSELSMGGLGVKAEVLSAALDKGVNLFHTAQAYDPGELLRSSLAGPPRPPRRGLRDGSKCTGCPNGLAVEEMVMCVLYYDRELGLPGHARQVYRELRHARARLPEPPAGP